MPDWTRYVAERLVDSKLAPEEQHDVVAEIAEHLEEATSNYNETAIPTPSSRCLLKCPTGARFVETSGARRRTR
jgi:hypothetical protein